MGPFPEVVCLIINIAKCFIPLTFVIIITILTILKFVFLCVMKRIPEFDDDLLSRRIISSVMIFGTVILAFKYGLWTKPSTNEVSNNHILQNLSNIPHFFSSNWWNFDQNIYSQFYRKPCRNPVMLKNSPKYRKIGIRSRPLLVASLK